MTDKETQAGKGVDPHGEPVIDPTKNVLDLVKAAIERQDDLRQAAVEKLEAEIKGLSDLMTAKFETVDALRFEKYRAIDTQFAERDKRVEQLSISNNTALTAALDTQKEAATKSEAAFTKQIDGIVALISAANKSIDDKIAALNSRMDRGDGSQIGKADHVSSQRSDIGMYVGIIGMAGGMIIGIIGIASRFMN